jgi:putative DNA primase/helicase
MAGEGFDDRIVRAGAAARDLDTLPRTESGSIADALMPFLELPNDPSAETVERALRVSVAGLEGCDPLRRMTVRSSLVDRLTALGVSAAAKTVDAALAVASVMPKPTSGSVLALEDPSPWPEPVDGAELLDEIAALARRYTVLPEGGPDTFALWTAFSYALDAFDVAPNLALSSPLNQCGKTKTLDLLGSLVRRGLPTSNLTAATVFRAIERFSPTLVMDEADTYALVNDELRGVLNSGHTRGTAFVLRTVGDDHEPRLFSTWAAKAFALIGALPATLEDRSIVLPMRRRSAAEPIQRMRRRHLARDLEPIRRRLIRWAQDAMPALEIAEPACPEGLEDRQEDNWTPLLAIADLAGGSWPERARRAARILCGARADDPTLALRLLQDVAEVWPEDEDKIARSNRDALVFRRWRNLHRAWATRAQIVRRACGAAPDFKNLGPASGHRAAQGQSRCLRATRVVIVGKETPDEGFEASLFRIVQAPLVTYRSRRREAGCLL